MSTNREIDRLGIRLLKVGSELPKFAFFGLRPGSNRYVVYYLGYEMEVWAEYGHTHVTHVRESDKYSCGSSFPTSGWRVLMQEIKSVASMAGVL